VISILQVSIEQELQRQADDFPESFERHFSSYGHLYFDISINSMQAGHIMHLLQAVNNFNNYTLTINHY